MPRNPTAKPINDTLEGVLERITFYNAGSGFLIGKLRCGEDQQEATVVGPAAQAQCGETLRLEGCWNNHPQHGKQFSFVKYETKLPASVYGIRKYLSSGLVRGIGKTYATNIVNCFGADTLRVLSEEPARLLEVPGIGEKRARSIKAAWQAQRVAQEAMVFLKTHGISDALCLSLVNRYGNQVRTILATEPYRIVRDVKGVSFKTADTIALNLGSATNSAARIDAGIFHAMQQLEGDGHACTDRHGLTSKAAEILELDADAVSVRMATLNSGELVECTAGVFQTTATARDEQTAAQALGQLLAAPSCLPSIVVDKAIEWAQKKVGFDFAAEQADSIRTALTSKVSILTGGPGTGKTTILQALVSILEAKQVRLQLTAPTGRASRRMADATRHFSQTIHRLLRFDPSAGKFALNEKAPLEGDFVVMDEASMLDIRLAAALFRAIPAKAHLLIVGDVDQLPSVGPGNVLKDLIESRRFPVTRLQVPFRQDEGSGIVAAAHGILAGRGLILPPVDDPKRLDFSRDVHFIRAANPDACVTVVRHLCRDLLPAHLSLDPLHEIQVLAPMHRGIAGIANLNDQLRAVLNPQGALYAFGQTLFREGDKVIQTRNNYDKNIFNGDLGIITAVHPTEDSMEVDFDGQSIRFARREVASLQPAYAISVHKSQGSEYPVVVFPLLKQHCMVLQRNLIYTGLTRAKKKVFFVGDPAAYAMAIRNNKTLARRTDLIRKLEFTASA